MNKKIIIIFVLIVTVLISIAVYLFLNRDSANFNDYISSNESFDEIIIPNDDTPEDDEMSIVQEFANQNNITGTFQYITSPDWMPDLWEVFSSGYDRCFIYYDSDTGKTTVIVLDDEQPRVFQVF